VAIDSVAEPSVVDDDDSEVSLPSDALPSMKSKTFKAYVSLQRFGFEQPSSANADTICAAYTGK